MLSASNCGSSTITIENSNSQLWGYIDQNLPDDNMRQLHLLFVKSRLDELNTNEKFPIDFEVLWKEVGYSRKDHAKTALLEFAVKGVDFEYSRVAGETSPLGGRPSEKIMLTYDCARKFALRAKTSMGMQVQEYFVALRETLIK